MVRSLRVRAALALLAATGSLAGAGGKGNLVYLAGYLIGSDGLEASGNIGMAAGGIMWGGGQWFAWTPWGEAVMLAGAGVAATGG
jgi:hypothetical protein